MPDNNHSKIERERIAIIDWTHLIEDYLDNIGVSFEEFRNEMTGGWLFGYLQALQSAGFEPIFYCFSLRRENIGSFKHRPTGAEIRTLPAPVLYRLIRRVIKNPYALTFEESTGKLKLYQFHFYRLAYCLAEYCSTPISSLRREFQSRNISKIICQEYESGRFDSLALMSKLSSFSLFAVFQGGTGKVQGRFRNVWRRWAVRNCAGLIIGSQSEIDRVVDQYELAKSRIARIYNPLILFEGCSDQSEKIRRDLKINQNAKIVIWHGRIDLKRKGLDLILECWEKLIQKKDLSDCHLLIVGDGNDSQSFRELIESYNFNNITWLAEYINNRCKIRDLLRVGDVYLFASRHEGFPMAPLEAMSIGLPLVASNVSGIAEILENGEESGGIMVDIEDTSAMTENIYRLLVDENLRLKIGARAKQRVEDFQLETVGRQFRQFITRYDKQ